MDRVRPMRHVLDGVPIGASWRIRLNRPCAASMRPFCQILGPLVELNDGTTATTTNPELGDASMTNLLLFEFKFKFNKKFVGRRFTQCPLVPYNTSLVTDKRILYGGRVLV